MPHWLMKSEPDECSIDDALAAPGRAIALRPGNRLSITPVTDAE